MNIMAVRWGRLYEGTRAEHALEDAVAALGVPYRTQFPGWKYGCRFYPDFVLPTLKLVIEVDDASHEDKVEADEERSRIIFDTWGFHVVRCTNEDALENPVGTLKAMLKSVGLWPLPSSLPRLRDALPPLRKAPQKLKRQAKSAARRAKRKAPRGRPRSASRTRQSPPQFPKPAPTPVQVPLPTSLPNRT